MHLLPSVLLLLLCVFSNSTESSTRALFTSCKDNCRVQPTPMSRERVGFGQPYKLTLSHSCFFHQNVTHSVESSVGEEGSSPFTLSCAGSVYHNTRKFIQARRLMRPADKSMPLCLYRINKIRYIL